MESFLTHLSGQDFLLPEMLLGSLEVKPETSGRLALPALWKPSFSGSAFVMAGRLGQHSCAMLFPEGNMKAILAQVSDWEIKGVLERSANQISIDAQYRIVIPEGIRTHSGDQTVSLMGASSHLKIVTADVAREITAGDKDVVSQFFSEVR